MNKVYRFLIIITQKMRWQFYYRIHHHNKNDAKIRPVFAFKLKLTEGCIFSLCKPQPLNIENTMRMNMNNEAVNVNLGIHC